MDNLKFRKTKFRSMERDKEIGRLAALLREGWTDGTYDYYKAASGTWYAIDRDTGCSVSQGATKKYCAERAHSEEIQKRIEDTKKAKYPAWAGQKTYNEIANIWYGLLVECGAIMEV